MCISDTQTCFLRGPSSLSLPNRHTCPSLRPPSSSRVYLPQLLYSQRNLAQPELSRPCWSTSDRRPPCHRSRLRWPQAQPLLKPLTLLQRGLARRQPPLRLCWSTLPPPPLTRPRLFCLLLSLLLLLLPLLLPSSNPPFWPLYCLPPNLLPPPPPPLLLLPPRPPALPVFSVPPVSAPSVPPLVPPPCRCHSPVSP